MTNYKILLINYRHNQTSIACLVKYYSIYDLVVVMRLATKVFDDYAVIFMEGSLSNENLKELEDVLVSILDKKLNIFLDLINVTFLCSAALDILLSYSKSAGKSNLNLIMYGLKEDIKKIFMITELDKHLLILDTLDEARAYLEKK